MRFLYEVILDDMKLSATIFTINQKYFKSAALKSVMSLTGFFNFVQKVKTFILKTTWGNTSTGHVLESSQVAADDGKNEYHVAQDTQAELCLCSGLGLLH